MSSKPALQWYPFYPADYYAKTIGLTFSQDAAYRRLLDVYYTVTRGPLPLDLKVIHSLVRASNRHERVATAYVLGRYFSRSTGGYEHHTCDTIIEAQQNKIRKLSEAGRKGGLTRSLNQASSNRSRLEVDLKDLSPLSPLSGGHAEQSSRGKGNGNGKGIGRWWLTEQDTETMARELGMWPARAGESWDDLRGRMRAKIRDNGHGGNGHE